VNQTYAATTIFHLVQHTTCQTVTDQSQLIEVVQSVVLKVTLALMKITSV
jgi:hypothetical protein